MDTEDAINDIKIKIAVIEERVKSLGESDAETEARLLREIASVKSEVSTVATDYANQKDQIYDLKDRMPNQNTYMLITGILMAVVGVVVGVFF